MQVWRLRARRTCARALPPERLASCADGLVFACFVGYVDDLLLLTDDFGIALASIGRPQGLAGVASDAHTPRFGSLELSRAHPCTTHTFIVHFSVPSPDPQYDPWLGCMRPTRAHNLFYTINSLSPRF